MHFATDPTGWMRLGSAEVGIGWRRENANMKEQNSMGIRTAVTAALFALGAMAIAGGCGVSAVSAPEDGIDKIVGGTTATASAEVSASTVAVVIDETWLTQLRKTCSGTLIGKRVVLTADHCFAAGPDCRILFALDVLDPNAASVKCKAKRGAGADIALAYLEEDAPSGYEPVPYLTAKDELKVDVPIILAGYGMTQMDADTTRGTLRFKEQKISMLDPERKEFRYDGSGGCNGDSGGPAYVRNDKGGLSLAGVHIAGDYRCRLSGTNTDVRYFTDWIAKTLAEESGGQIDCTQDVPPDSQYTCAQQAQWNKCNESWMKGFCNISCGRCR